MQDTKLNDMIRSESAQQSSPEWLAVAGFLVMAAIGLWGVITILAVYLFRS